MVRSILYLIMEGGEMIREYAMFVDKETETSLFLQQRFLTAVRNEQLHVHLSACQRFQALAISMHIKINKYLHLVASDTDTSENANM